MNYDAIFITASMLSPNRRQAFTVPERLQQIFKTLNSIKQRVPNSFCLMIEGTVLNEELRKEYEKHYDHVLDFGSDPEVLPYVNHPHNIGHGEMKLLEKGCDYIINNVLNKSTATHLFKLGARYELTDAFCLSKFNPNKYGFRRHFDKSSNSFVYTTGLYSIPIDEIEEFKQMMIDWQNILTTHSPMIEKMYCERIPTNKVQLVDPLGLKGQLSYNRVFFSI